MSDGRLWIKTPLIRSSALSERLGAEVYLKIEVSGVLPQFWASSDQYWSRVTTADIPKEPIVQSE